MEFSRTVLKRNLELNVFFALNKEVRDAFGKTDYPVERELLLLG
jgi:hypothetical protein